MKTQGTFIFQDNQCVYTLHHIDSTIYITFKYKEHEYKVQEELEMSNFGINDYSIAYLKYLLMHELNIELPEKNYNPTKY